MDAPGSCNFAVPRVWAGWSVFQYARPVYEGLYLSIGNIFTCPFSKDLPLPGRTARAMCLSVAGLPVACEVTPPFVYSELAEVVCLVMQDLKVLQRILGV